MKKFMALLLTAAVVVSLAFSADAVSVSHGSCGYTKFDYTLETADGGELTSDDIEDFATVIVFFSRNDNNGFLTLDDLQCSDWITDSRVKVVAAETSGMTGGELENYRETYGFTDITFCSDQENVSLTAKEMSTSGSTAKTPVIVITDQERNIRKVFTGYQKPDYLKTVVEPFAEAPDAPANLRRAVSGLFIWDSVTDAYCYDIYRADTVGGDYAQVGNTKATIWSDPEAEAGKTYYYKVKAVQQLNDISVNSDFSNGVSVTVKPK